MRPHTEGTGIAAKGGEEEKTRRMAAAGAGAQGQSGQGARWRKGQAAAVVHGVAAG